MGIYPESSHHEEGPGQNEIDFKYSEPLTAADNAMTFVSVVGATSARNGVFADFSPKPLSDKAGSGFHINFSIENGKKVKDAAIAGVLKHAPAMTAFLNHTEESYRRLGEKKAPAYVCWGRENRSQLIRIPAAEGDYARAELRSPDPFANPYLAFALIIYAALDGIEKGYKLKKGSDLNIYSADEKTLAKYRRLPSTKEEAIAVSLKSGFIKSVLPKTIIKSYLEK